MRQIHEIPKEGSLYFLLNSLLGAYNRRTDVMAKQPIGDTSISQKLDAIIEMQRNQASVPDDLALAKEELSLIHVLVADLASGGDPEKVKQITANLRNARERLQTAIDSQKGDPNG